MTNHSMRLPSQLRDQLAADFRPVRVLRSPLARTLALLPIAMIALFAAPVAFNVRPDASQLGWMGLWGLSVLQSIMGLAVLAAALRESVPGRGWSPVAIALWLALPMAAIVGVTLVSWNVSPVLLRSAWWQIAGVCFAGSAATALPIVAMSAILASRAYPTRPAIAGVLLGFGAGLIADAGWRIFCHFSEPAHVLSAHLAAVILSAIIGTLAAVRFVRRLV